MSQGNAPPKVCQVLHSLHTGGAEVLACRLARRLSGRFQFLFACLDEKGDLGEEMEADGSVIAIADISSPLASPGIHLSRCSRLANVRK